VRFGVGMLGQVSSMLRDLGVRRALLVTTAGRRHSDGGERLERAMGRARVATFAGVVPHLPADVVRQAFEQARQEGTDGIVSFGGGSTIDCGKAVSFFVEQQAGTPGRTVLDRPAVPHLAIPTTYSPGVLGGLFAMTDPRTRTKAATGSPTTAPSAAVYDPSLVVDLPADVVAGSALDALAAGVQGVLDVGRSPETETLALAAAQRISGVLPLVVDTPGDLLVSSDLMEAAVLASRVLQQTSVSVVSALAQLLGGRTGGAHGSLIAVLLAPTMRWQLQADPVAFSRLAEALGGTDDAATEVAELAQRVGAPDRLGALGVDYDDIAAVARLSQAHPAIRDARPPLDEAAVLELLGPVT
jgi:alcohol dehydrogenase class IV